MKTKKQLLRILLSLVLVLGLMPGMSMIVYADDTDTCRVQKGLTSDGYDWENGPNILIDDEWGTDVSKLFDNNTGSKWYIYWDENDCTNTDLGISIKFHTDSPVVLKEYELWTGDAVSSGYWSRNPRAWKLEGSNSATGPWNALDTKESGDYLPQEGNKKAVFAVHENTNPYQYYRLTVTEIGKEGDKNPYHALVGELSGKDCYYFELSEIKLFSFDHDFTYSADGATITATCKKTDCPLSDRKVTLSIVAPTLTTYGQTGEDINANATLTGLSDFNEATDKTIAATDIKYVGRDGTSYEESTTAPTNAGKYTAKITVEEQTASVDYEIAKATTSITENPTAKTLTYTGSAQELVTAGTASGGEMQYALGTKDAATQPYTTSIPTATEAGTYYVWYKAKGNEGYKDSEAKCVTATIDAAPSGGAVDGRGGAVTTEQLKKEYDNAEVKPDSSAAKAGITSTTDAIDALQNEDRKIALLGSAVECGGADVVVKNEGETRSELVTSKAEALAAVLTPREMVEAVIGNKKVDVILEVQQTQAPDDQAKSDIESKKDANEQVVYINVNLYVEKDGERDPNPVTEAKNDLKITFTIPEAIRGEGRTFRLIWSHKNADGTLDTRFLNDEDSDPNTFTVSVNKLSTVGLTYTTGSVTPTYTPSYSSGSSYTGSSYSSGSGDGGGSGTSYIVASSKLSKGYYDKIGKSSVEYVSPKISKKAKVAKVPAKIKIGKKIYKVTAVSPYAFTGQDGLRTVIIGKNVKRISPYAFYGCDKLKVLRVRSRSLTAKKIRNCLKGSDIDRVVVLRKAHNKFKFYKKIFTKKITGASTKLSVTKQK